MSIATTPEKPSIPAARRAGGEIARILELSVPVYATLAECEMSVESIIAITVGAILEFDVPVETDLTLFVGNRPVGRGQAVKAGENFGIRVTRIEPVVQRIGALGGA